MNANETTYQDVKNIMTNSIEEFFHKIEVKKKHNSIRAPQYFYSHKLLGLADPKEGIIWKSVQHVQPCLQACALWLHFPSGKGQEHYHDQPFQGEIFEMRLYSAKNMTSKSLSSDTFPEDMDNPE